MSNAKLTRSASSAAKISRGLTAALEKVGVRLKPEDERKIRLLKDEHPEIPTGDIIVQLKIAPEAKVIEALAALGRETAHEMLIDRVEKAKAQLKTSALASRHLGRVAERIAEKGPCN